MAKDLLMVLLLTLLGQGKTRWVPLKTPFMVVLVDIQGRIATLIVYFGSTYQNYSTFPGNSLALFLMEESLLL